MYRRSLVYFYKQRPAKCSPLILHSKNKGSRRMVCVPERCRCETGVFQSPPPITRRSYPTDLAYLDQQSAIYITDLQTSGIVEGHARHSSVLLSVLRNSRKRPERLAHRCRIALGGQPISPQQPFVPFLCSTSGQYPSTVLQRDSLVMCSNSPRVLGNPGTGLPLAPMGALSAAFIAVALALCKRAGSRCWLVPFVVSTAPQTRPDTLTRVSWSRSAL